MAPSGRRTIGTWRVHSPETTGSVSSLRSASSRVSFDHSEVRSLEVFIGICFGWIDGVRRGIDADSYAIRFTPRRATSIWSAVNLRRVEALIGAGRMQPAGLQAFDRRNPEKSGVYSFEQRRQAQLTPEAEQRFRSDVSVWAYFQAQPPGYRSMMIWWVMSAKRDSTRERRLERLIRESAAGRRIGPLSRPGE